MKRKEEKYNFFEGQKSVEILGFDSDRVSIKIKLTIMDFHLHLRRYQGGQEDDIYFSGGGDSNARSSPVSNESPDAMDMDDYGLGGFGSGFEEQDGMDIN